MTRSRDNPSFPLGAHRAIPVCSLALLCLVLVLTDSTSSQSPALVRSYAQQAAQPSSTIPTPVDELQVRLRASAAARDAGDPAAVTSTNFQVLALAFRKLANIRTTEGAFPQAADLYRRSLSLEDAAETHVGLASCYLYSNRPDDSLVEASKALLIDPNNARAFNVQGKAWMKKRQYQRAVESFERVVQIQPAFEPAYALGVSLLDLKNPDSQKKAAQVFDTIVASMGDSGSLHVFFGHAYRDAEMQDDAIRELRKAVALDPRTPHAHYFLGLALLWKNEWTDTPEIRQEFVSEISNYPRDFLANYFLGYLDSNDRRYDQANLHLKVATELDPSWPEPWLFLGLNAYAQGDLAHSEQYLRKCIEITGKDESRANYQVRRAYVTLGRIMTASGRADQAAPYLEKAREFQKQSLAEAQQEVAGKASEEGSVSPAAVVALLNSQEDPALGMSSQPVDPTVPLDPSVLAHSGLSEETKKAAVTEENRLRLILGTSFNDLATSEAIRHDYPSALSHYQEAERWDPDVPGLMRNLGVAAFRVPNYQECVRALSQVLAGDPSNAAVRAMMGSAYFALDKYREAAQTIAPLGRRAMRDSTLGYAWAASLSRLGELSQATHVLEEYEKSALSPDALVLVGQLWTDMGDYSRAVQTFHRALDREPALEKARYFAGLAQLRWEHDNEAIEEFTAALNLNPDDADAKVGLGYIYMQQAKQSEAIELFRSVISTHPDNGNAQYQLGKLLLDAGKVQEAVTHLEAAVRALPQTDYVHYQLQSAYRKESRSTDADRELQIYRELKGKNRELTVPHPMGRP